MEAPPSGISSEEHDLLARSNKKIKANAIQDANMDDSMADGGDIASVEEPPVSPAVTPPQRSALSYRDRLLGFNGDGYEMDDSDEDEWDSDMEIDSDEYTGEALKAKQAKVSWPILPMTGEERKNLCKYWKNTLIINLLGKKLGFRFFLARLERLWSNI